MRIEIVCTGDEVLSGKIVNSNYSYMCRRLEDVGLKVVWGTTVGDDRERLLEAFRLASGRADAVIVNGGLGPTVDDLSQEIAAEAAGVELEIRQEWLTKMESFFKRRGRPMSPNNRKQAMLPVSAEMIDNPVGTACGFAVDIGKARFFFTPGVPRELFRMLDDQLIPRLQAMSGEPSVNQLKRFHSYGIGESRADTLLADVVDLAPDGSVKLGFQAHYPQLETKLAVRGASEADIARNLEPVEAEVRKRLGSFVIAEDDATLEGEILDALAGKVSTVAVSELHTNGQIGGRLAACDGGRGIFRRGVIANDLNGTFAALDLRDHAGPVDRATVEAAARGVMQISGTDHGLAVLIAHGSDAGGGESDGTIFLAVASGDATVSRSAQIIGDEHRVRLGAVEMGLDCLRRHLQGLAFDERVDFEKSN